MNKASRIAAKINFEASPFQIRASLFHCTPVSERRKGTHWDYTSSFKSSSKRSNQYRKRLKKQSVLHNVSDFSEHIFQSWKSHKNEHNQHGGHWNSWFRPNFRDDGFKRGRSRNRTSHSFRRGIEFIDDYDDDVNEFESIFRSAFGGGKTFYWSFIDDEYSSNFRTSRVWKDQFEEDRGWKHQFEDEYEDSDSSSEYERERPMNDMSSHRLALGLTPSGPLKLKDVKNAYRACALKWHPDRHQGSFKVVAEEKFKEKTQLDNFSISRNKLPVCNLYCVYEESSYCKSRCISSFLWY